MAPQIRRFRVGASRASLSLLRRTNKIIVSSQLAATRAHAKDPNFQSPALDLLLSTVVTDGVVQRMHGEACTKWPSIGVSIEAFARYCERLGDGQTPSEEMAAHAAEIYLCCACTSGNTAAQLLFEREACGVVRSAITRVNGNQEFIHETLQEFWARLLAGPQAKLLEYRGRGPLQAWLRVVATHLALDRYRAARVVAAHETELCDCLAEQDLGPESTLTRDRFHSAFCEALSRAVSDLSLKDRNLLGMHVFGRCSIDQIGRTYNVHRATAARWLEQIRARIWQAVRKDIELTGTPLTDSEFQCIARVMGSDLNIDLNIDLSILPPDSTVQRSYPIR